MRRRAPILAALLLLVSAPPVAAQEKPVVTPADYGKWETLEYPTLSPDGKWIAYRVRRVNEEYELRFRRVDDDSTRVAAWGNQPAFSADGRWLAYLVGVSEEERKRREKANQPVRSTLELVDLRSGETIVIPEIAAFAFSGDGAYLALRGYPPPRGDGRGADLIVRDLASGTHTAFGNVADFAWRDQGALLAMTIDAGTKAGNGVQLYDPGRGTLRTLDSDTSRYTGLVWREDADDLAVLRVFTDSLHEDASHRILAWTGLAGNRPRSWTFDPAAAPDFPEGTRIVDIRPLRWAKDGKAIFFGIKEWERKEKEEPADTAAAGETEERAGVEVWHAADVDIIPEQKFKAPRDRDRNDLAVWHLDDGRFVRLGDELTEEVRIIDGARWAIGIDHTPWERERMFGPEYNDYYRIDLRTGERVKIAEKVQFFHGASPGGRYILYFKDDHYWTVDLASGRTTNITRDVPATFVNVRNDLTIEQKPPFGVAAWTEDDRSVILYDRYDLWEVRPDGSRATRLTDGAAERIRHRYAWVHDDANVIRRNEPIYLTLYGERSKKYGYGRLRFGRPVERMVWLDKYVSRLRKADDADVFVYMIEGFDDSPDYFVAGPDLARARQVTETNPFQNDFAWGRSEVVEFVSARGDTLQGALHYPANYQPGKQYPMIVYIYETRSQTVHNYSVPSERSPYNPAVFTSQGYFVFQPDIVYRPRNPGLSAVDAVVPAVEKVLETGMIDRDRIGLVGHSWGAYQTAFIITQTDLFKAAVAGAPLTDLISMYLSIYWNTGGTDARIFEISQGRMEVPFWEDLDAYMRNSPLFNIQAMDTPLLVAFGDKDGAVDWHQGIELYNAARRAGKPLVMLVYEGENHSLVKKANQIDYHRRINQWFAHYLKDEPAPAWITDGVRYLDREKEKLEPVSPGTTE